MKGTLLLSILGVRGNYHEGLFLDSRGKDETDTYQWWIMEDESYTSLTFALGRTIRTFRVPKPAEEMFRLAEENQARFESSTIKKVRIDFDDVFDADEAKMKFAAHELEPTLVLYDQSIPIWTYQGIEGKNNSAKVLVSPNAM